MALILSTACLIAAVGCSGGDSPVSGDTSVLELSLSEVTLDEGETHTLAAASLRRGAAVPLTVQLNPSTDLVWTSSNSAVASFSGGEIHAHRPGSAILTATAHAGATASLRVEVLPAPPNLEMLVESGVQLPVLVTYPSPVRVKLTDRDGNILPNESVEFAVTEGGGAIEPSSVVSDADGIASTEWTLGHVAGVQSIVAFLESRPDRMVELSVSALPGAPTALVFQQGSLDLRAGQLFRLSARLEDAYGNPVEGYPVVWASSDADVASVDQAGLITPQIVGAAEITASVSFGAAGEGAPSSSAELVSTASVTVTSGDPATLVKRSEIPEESTPGAPLGASLTAQVADFYGNPVSGVEVFWDVEWGDGTLYPEARFTDDEGIARAQWLLGPEEGVQIASALLPADVTHQPARAPGNGNGGGPSADVILRFQVRAARKSTDSSDGSSIGSVIVTTPDPSIGAGETTGLNAEVRDTAGNLMSGQTIEWSSSSSATVSVSPNGYSATAAGHAPGASLITARTAGESGWVEITVDDSGGSSDGSGDPVVASLVMTVSATELQVSETATLSLQVLDSSGDPIAGQAVSWSSSNPAVATLGGGGYGVTATALSTGSTVITASVGSETASKTLTVIGADDPPAPPPTSGPVPAFPGAEGWGAMALSSCDRANAEVLFVTNLNDSGSGSLRAALEGARSDRLSVIAFRVAGIIRLDSRIEVRSRCIYVAGQTAPGSGVTISAPGNTALFLRYDVSDVVMRYVRMRGGYGGDKLGAVNLLVGSGQNMIFDHMSFSWTTDKLFAISKYDASWSTPIRNITLQRSMLSEVFAHHPTAVQLSGSDRWNPDVRDIDLHHNLIAHNSHRNPMNNTNGLKFVNNVVYNWNQGASHGSDRSVGDYIGNYFKTGPYGTSYDWEITYDCGQNAASYYAARNVGPHNSSDSADNWTGSSRMVACYYKTGSYVGEPLPGSFRRNSPLTGPAQHPIVEQSATDAYTSVLQDVGANRRLRCDGTMVGNSDAVDMRILNDVANGTGPGSYTDIQNESSVGGFPSVNPGSTCQDSDNDGMPNEFENRVGLDPSDASDGGNLHSSGYTYLEVFLNGGS